MKNLDIVKANAVRAVKNDGRLIADVAAEFGISRRKLYQWLSAKSDKAKISKAGKTKATDNVIGSEALVLKTQLKLLQTEVQLLKSQLSQYQITETLSNGRIRLDFQERPVANEQLKKAG